MLLPIGARGGHKHIRLISGRHKDAAKYPSGFCRAIVKGFIMYRRRCETGVKWSGSMGVFASEMAITSAVFNFTRPDLCDPDEEELHGRFIDDIKG